MIIYSLSLTNSNTNPICILILLPSKLYKFQFVIFFFSKLCNRIADWIAKKGFVRLLPLDCPKKPASAGDYSVRSYKLSLFVIKKKN